MTLIFERPVQPGKPATHAFVIGVGTYPDAKPGKGFNKDLRAVPDLASAADSAKRMCDWLLENKDNLDAPLATLEVLIGPAQHAAGATPYAWANEPAAPPDPPTVANVEAAGADWLGQLQKRPGDVAFFYACGHGARLGTDPLLFLQDINTRKMHPWGGFLNVGETANAFKQVTEISAGFFFLDACQEFSPKLELSKAKWVAQFIAPLDPFQPQLTREKVFMLSATSAGLKAYDGPCADNPNLRLGRFTQTLCLALDGAAVRSRLGRWVVQPASIIEDIIYLHGLRTDWREDELPFEPTQSAFPTGPFPIVAPARPIVPIVVFTNPAPAISNYDLSIFASPDRAPPVVDQRPLRAQTEWLAWVPASRDMHVAVAADNGISYEAKFSPDMPIFDQRILIP
ncbi:caspase family protein [Caulobacter ginsengisoli]|uniref:caspase family protein n=1 Tax=Caulobacter ginsengisoli TaxID=400775 RepID=UPI0027D91F66|nr:caspase family protein [Caulobacter ginsengisoli]